MFDERVSIWSKQQESTGPVMPGVNGTGWWRWCDAIALARTNIPVERFRLVDSTPQIIQAVLEAKGDPIWYYMGVPNKLCEHNIGEQ